MTIRHRAMPSSHSVPSIGRRTRHSRWIWLAVLLCVLPIAMGAQSTGQEDETLMQKKTKKAQAILAHLAKGDLAAVASDADALVRLAEEAGFEGRPEDYKTYGDEFVKITRELRASAKDRNMAGSFYHFSRMTSMCFSCHEHIRGKSK